jgi:hypothetical protein
MGRDVVALKPGQPGGRSRLLAILRSHSTVRTVVPGSYEFVRRPTHLTGDALPVERAADRLDSELQAMLVDQRWDGRSSSAEKKADALLRIAFARRSSQFSRSSAASRARSAVVRPARCRHGCAAATLSFSGLSPDRARSASPAHAAHPGTSPYPGQITAWVHRFTTDRLHHPDRPPLAVTFRRVLPRQHDHLGPRGRLKRASVTSTKVQPVDIGGSCWNAAVALVRSHRRRSAAQVMRASVASCNSALRFT